MSDDYEGVTHAGLLLVRVNGGPEVFLAQRSLDETDDPDVQETWEFPGGGLDGEESPMEAALREFAEEIGLPLGEHEVLHGWRTGNYQGFVVEPRESLSLSGWEATEEVQNVAWVGLDALGDYNLRPEVAALDIPALIAAAVSGNEETNMDNEPEIEEIEEPEFSADAVMPSVVPVHGIIAPEEAESGDARAFAAGAVTTRPLRLPFSWQKSAIGGHDGSVVVGSIDRIMRKDGLLHWEGLMMATEEAAELIGVIQFFGQYGVSIDGDKGSVDAGRTRATNTTWFDAVRTAGLTAVAIPAFHEAFVALGPHPDMPEASEGDVLVAGARGPEMLQFKRGSGWVSHPKETNRLHSYWTEKGQPGYAKIAWGTPGDWTRARALIGEKIAKNSPDKMKYLNQIISQWHYDALGYWPGELDRPGNKKSTEAGIVADSEGGWEAVLTSSASAPAAPAHYFDRHPDTGALVIEEPDAHGYRRTFGYLGEWGICHIGFDGRCVEVPEDQTGDFPQFHLGRTKTTDGYVKTGVITYAVEHRDAKRILSESADQRHSDNVMNAWASVCLGQDERGIWFSGVVLPHISSEDCTLIEASGQTSGEWRYGNLIGAQSVNQPGFAVLRASSAEYDADGNVIALVASSRGESCAPTPAERIAAIAQVMDEDEVLARFAAIRGTFGEGEE